MNKWQKLSLLSIAISLVTMAGIIYFTIDRESLDYLAKVSPFLIIVIIGAHFTSITFSSLKLMVLTRSAGHKVRFWSALKMILASLFMAAVTPSQMGGEPLRIKMLADEGVGEGTATAVVFGGRVMDLLFMLVAVSLVFIKYGPRAFSGDTTPYMAAAAVLVGLILAMLWLSVFKPEKMKKLAAWSAKKFGKRNPEKAQRRLERFNTEIDNFSISFKSIVKKKSFFLLAMLMTTGVWLADFSIPSIILAWFGLDPMWSYAISAQIIILFIAMVPLTPGSSGIIEITMLALFASVPSSLIGVFILLWRISTYYFNLVAGGIVSMKVIKEYGDVDDGSGDKGKGK